LFNHDFVVSKEQFNVEVNGTDWTNIQEKSGRMEFSQSLAKNNSLLS